MGTLIFDEFILSGLALEDKYIGTFDGKGTSMLFRFHFHRLIHQLVNIYFLFSLLEFFNNPILCQFWKTKLETIFFLELLLGWTDYLNWNPKHIIKLLQPLHANMPVLARDPPGTHWNSLDFSYQESTVTVPISFH